MNASAVGVKSSATTVDSDLSAAMPVPFALQLLRSGFSQVGDSGLYENSDLALVIRDEVVLNLRVTSIPAEKILGLVPIGDLSSEQSGVTLGDQAKRNDDELVVVWDSGGHTRIDSLLGGWSRPIELDSSLITNDHRASLIRSGFSELAGSNDRVYCKEGDGTGCSTVFFKLAEDDSIEWIKKSIGSDGCKKVEVEDIDSLSLVKPREEQIQSEIHLRLKAPSITLAFSSSGERILSRAIEVLSKPDSINREDVDLAYWTNRLSVGRDYDLPEIPMILNEGEDLGEIIQGDRELLSRMGVDSESIANFLTVIYARVMELRDSSDTVSRCARVVNEFELDILGSKFLIHSGRGVYTQSILGNLTRRELFGVGEDGALPTMARWDRAIGVHNCENQKSFTFTMTLVEAIRVLGYFGSRSIRDGIYLPRVEPSDILQTIPALCPAG